MLCENKTSRGALAVASKAEDFLMSDYLHIIKILLLLKTTIPLSTKREDFFEAEKI